MALLHVAHSFERWLLPGWHGQAHHAEVAARDKASGTFHQRTHVKAQAVASLLKALHATPHGLHTK
jgi:hypothetical protein